MFFLVSSISEFTEFSIPFILLYVVFSMIGVAYFSDEEDRKTSVRHFLWSTLILILVGGLCYTTRTYASCHLDHPPLRGYGCSSNK